LTRQRRENLTLIAVFLLLAVLLIGGGIAAAKGSRLPLGIGLIVLGAMWVIGRHTIYPPKTTEVGWASFSLWNRAQWSQWPKQLFVAQATVYGGLMVLVGIAVLLTEALR
jgi:hypothetical protein